mmetsp:Transcript_54974/g.87230  ORF Transcript_54974/g.87230 Transcript_54974/m.87230 type:complete len:268 (-) Transcript_54974:16-819(-)
MNSTSREIFYYVLQQRLAHFLVRNIFFRCQSRHSRKTGTLAEWQGGLDSGSRNLLFGNAIRIARCRGKGKLFVLAIKIQLRALPRIMGRMMKHKNDVRSNLENTIVLMPIHFEIIMPMRKILISIALIYELLVNDEPHDCENDKHKLESSTTNTRDPIRKEKTSAEIQVTDKHFSETQLSRCCHNIFNLGFYHIFHCHFCWLRCRRYLNCLRYSKAACDARDEARAQHHKPYAPAHRKWATRSALWPLMSTLRRSEAICKAWLTKLR